MGSGDGEWIRAEADGESPAGDDGWPDEEWPEYDGSAAAPSATAGPAAGPTSGPVTGKHWGHGGIPGFSGWIAAAVASVRARWRRAGRIAGRG